MSYIEFNNVSKIYQMGEIEIKALNDVNFTIEKGELAVILGASGAGKTTILNILGGMDSCSYGSVVIDNEDIAKYNDHKLCMYRRNDIGFVFQFVHHLFLLSVSLILQLLFFRYCSYQTLTDDLN